MKCRIQIIDLSDMTGMCSLNSQHGGPDHDPANVGCSYFRYAKIKATMHLTDALPKKWTKYNKYQKQPHKKMLK